MATPAGPGTTNDAANSRSPPTCSPPPGRRSRHGSQRAPPAKVTHSTQELPFPPEERRPRTHPTARKTVPAQAPGGSRPHPAPAFTHNHQKPLPLSTPAAVPNPGHWRSGIGAELHAACVEQWRADGKRAATLEVHVDNQRAQAFYARQGWAPDPEQPPGEGDHHLSLTYAVNGE
ncbi:GNAT family N-acetyltransferase [Streptomyces flaveus]|uniref:GNAT family N-acetyltransferase n=1 Tax=Streptomyces flaveus TaxID=66370 RepID=UPI003D9F443D